LHRQFGSVVRKIGKLALPPLPGGVSSIVRKIGKLPPLPGLGSANSQANNVKNAAAAGPQELVAA
jgi:hypothetical protein